MKALRMTEEQLEAIKSRIGKVRTHRIAELEEMSHLEVKTKYGNVKTEVDGIWFASKKEAERYQQLRLMELANEIADLKRQVSFKLRVNGIEVCRYICDFQYRDKNGARVIEDAKGFRNAVYRLKKKLMKAVLKIEILET